MVIFNSRNLSNLARYRKYLLQFLGLGFGFGFSLDFLTNLGDLLVAGVSEVIHKTADPKANTRVVRA